MSRYFTLFLYPCLMLAIMLGGCASSNVLESSTTESTTPEPDGDLEDLFWARQDSATMHFNQANVDFMTGMIGHHAQALIMSSFAPSNSANPSIQTLAARIINAQNDEIALMQKWLRERDQAVPEVHIEGSKLMVHGAGDHAMHAHMPGMLTQEQLDDLGAAQGNTFDRLFLTYMIQHHQGAVTMVEEMFAQDGSGLDEANFKIASDINVDQITEIARMKKMLKALPSD